MSKHDKRVLYRLSLSLILCAVALLSLKDLPYVIAFLIAYIIIGYDILKEAVENIFRGQVFDENFLMAIATIGAILLGEYAEGVAVMIFYQVGELFQRIAVGRSRKSIAALMDIRPDFANVLRDDELITVDPDEVSVGEIIVVKPGEKVPLDAVVIEGSSSIDNAALTGESIPVSVEVDSTVFSGSVNLTGLLKLRVTHKFEQSTVARILDLVENASTKKAVAENFITKFARVYTPIVVIAAVFLGVLPPLLIDGQSFAVWIERALIFLVISCPCALVISVPMTFFGGIGGASKCGILIKGGNYMETLAKVRTVVFDKTGTLTKGIFKVTKVAPNGVDEETLLALAAVAEANSNHPIATSILAANQTAFNPKEISNVREFAGRGLSVEYKNQTILAGNVALMHENGLDIKASDGLGTIVHVAVNGNYCGYIVISDEVKASAQSAIASLKKIGINELVMLTGDRKSVGEHVAKQLSLTKVYAELMPDQKVAVVEKLLQNQSARQTLAFVGDGINDAPVLSRADIGIAMGAIGSDAAIEAADIVLMDDNPEKIATAILISKKTIGIAKQNIAFAITIKVLFLILGAFGFANMWMAVFADVGVAAIAILNAMRALSISKISYQNS